MKALKIICVLCFLFAFCACACAAEYVQGEALVTLRAPSEAPANFADTENFAANVAASVNAQVATIYGALSVANEGKIFALFRSDTCTTKELISALKNNPDVLSASPNYKVKASSKKRRLYN